MFKRLIEKNTTLRRLDNKNAPIKTRVNDEDMGYYAGFLSLISLLENSSFNPRLKRLIF